MVTTTAAPTQVRNDAETLATKDKVTIGLIVFFALVAFTLEGYFLIFNQSLEGRTDLFAKALSLYWPADYNYRIPGMPVEKAYVIALESVNTCVTQLISFVLIFGILKKKTWRHPLQLVIATYTFYGTFLYYYAAHLSDYKVFANHGTYPFLMFYLANLPWFVAYLWMAYESFRYIAARLKS